MEISKYKLAHIDIWLQKFFLTYRFIDFIHLGSLLKR